MPNPDLMVTLLNALNPNLLEKSPAFLSYDTIKSVPTKAHHLAAV